MIAQQPWAAALGRMVATTVRKAAWLKIQELQSRRLPPYSGLRYTVHPLLNPGQLTLEVFKDITHPDTSRSDYDPSLYLSRQRAENFILIFRC